MSAALMDLVAVGLQDVRLTGEPQMTYFKQAYKRYTNFAMEPIRQVIEGKPIQGNWSEVNVSRNGDLLSYLWIEDAAGAAGPDIDMVELQIGGQKIDEMSGAEIAAMGAGFSNRETASLGYANMVPLPFFFSRDSGNALPLVALSHQDVCVRIKWGDLNGSSPVVWGNFVHLDTAERKAIAESQLTMLIEQHQRTPVAAGDRYVALPFNHPVKCIYTTDDALGGANPSDTASIEFNGKSRIPHMLVNNYWSGVQRSQHTEYDTASSLKLYSFALCANSASPCGSCNFSRIDDARIARSNTTSAGFVYALNWNSLKIEGGVGALLYAN